MKKSQNRRILICFWKNRKRTIKFTKLKLTTEKTTTKVKPITLTIILTIMLAITTITIIISKKVSIKIIKITMTT